MKKYLDRNKHALYLTFALVCSVSASAQIIINSTSLNYQQNFNTLDTTSSNSSYLPIGWSIIEYGNSSTVNNQYKGNSGTATTGDAYSYGSPGDSNRALGSLATSGSRSIFGAFFKNNTGTIISEIYISYRGEQWRRGNCISDTLLFRYSITATGLGDTAASAWTIFHPLSLISPYAGSLTSTALNGNANGNHVTIADTINVTILPGDSVFFSWSDKDVTGSDDGLAIDDLSVTFTTSGTPIPENIYLVGKSPEGSDIDPAVSALSMHFDHLIEQGDGQIILHNENGITTTFQVPSPQITVVDSSATLSGILLENSSRYYILMSEGTFRKSGGTIASQSIADTTFWTFATADTVVPRPLTTLNESFENCTDSALGIFKQYNSLGFKTWKCTTGGHTGSSCAGMSGGISDGISDSNMDWLISTSAFDFSAMSRPELSFWQKKRFSGTVTRTIRIALDYIPGSNPALATWTTLLVQDMVDEPSDNWAPIADIDLSPYKGSPFFLAFTYSCGEQGAYELDYDDIKVEDEALKIDERRSTPFSLKVLGEATGQSINFSVTAAKKMVLNINICDLNGRSCFQTMVNVRDNQNTYTANNSGLKPGLYIIKAWNAGSYTTAKILIGK
jgi:hypothetical protein